MSKETIKIDYNKETDILINLEDLHFKVTNKHNEGWTEYAPFFRSYSKICYRDDYHFSHYNQRAFAIEKIIKILCKNCGISTPDIIISPNDTYVKMLQFNCDADEAVFYLHYHNQIENMFKIV